MLRSLLVCLLSTSLLAAPPTVFLEQHCYECHDADTKKGDLDLTTLTMDAQHVDLLIKVHDAVIDFTIQNRLETGTPEAQQYLRTWLKHLSTFVHSLDLAKARPRPQMVKAVPEHVIASVLGVEAQEYAIYLADAREVTDVGLGDPIAGELIITLPVGDWAVTFFDPTTGLSSKGPLIMGGESRLQVPEFRHDLALRLRRQ